MGSDVLAGCGGLPGAFGVSGKLPVSAGAAGDVGNILDGHSGKRHLWGFSDLRRFRGHGERRGTDGWQGSEDIGGAGQVNSRLRWGCWGCWGGWWP